MSKNEVNSDTVEFEELNLEETDEVNGGECLLDPMSQYTPAIYG